MFNRDMLLSEINKKGWSRYRLSKESGVAQTTLRDIFGEKKVTPSTKTLEKLASALNVPISAFFDDELTSTINSKNEINLLGDNIRKLRLEKGLGLNEVARLANITGGYLSSIENNKRTNVGTEILESIAKAIGVSVSDFYLQNEKSINENKEEFNSDIVRIERARRKMPKDERENMMKVLEAAFAKYFND